MQPIKAPSAYRQIREVMDRMEPSMTKDDARLRQELIELIESGRHVLIGAQALIRYTRPRFTKDTDYAVGAQTFRRVRKWFRERQDEVTYEDLGEAIRSSSLAVDVINAHNHPVLLKVLKSETGLASAEALAACKYVAMTSPTRDRGERIQDFADFSKLVLLEKFDVDALLAYMVGPYEERRAEIRGLCDDIAAGRPVQF